MAMCTCNFFAPSLQKMTALNVILPDKPGRFPVLYLLHGLSDDYTQWLRYTSIERYVAPLPLIVVMPDGGRSFYCNDPSPAGADYEDHFYKDIVGVTDRTFPTLPAPASRAIAGLSMGGYGSLMLAMRHPEVWSVASSHSGSVSFTHKSRPGRPDINDAAGRLPAGRYDLFALARKLKKSSHALALRMDCGTEDFLIGDNRLFHQHLEKLGVRHEYAEFPGQHNWEYWDEHIHQTLAFVMKHVKTEQRRPT